MTLIAIIVGTLAAGIGSVWLAAALSFGVLARFTQHMLSMAAGALLATAFTQLLPEAFEGTANARLLFMWLLGGLIFFFLLDKAELWHHGHEHHHGHGEPPGHDHLPPHDLAALALHPHAHAHVHVDTSTHPHPHIHSEQPPGAHAATGGHARLAPAEGHKAGGWAVLAGDSVHAFGDGILIASAFVADVRLGVVAAVAVLAHEVPHHMGDLMVLRQSSANNNAALVKVTMAGAVTALGGLAGYWLVELLRDSLPYFLVVAASSFIYVALADLIPQLQRQLSARQTAAQVAWLSGGIALVVLLGHLVHGH